ncbi:LysM peptidoglycan-binding domain-containing protein [Paenibacillus crassostreae]|uniref:LysM domain-containing protein n=1 Tax=Paenibacillus crassostreae TaxID=1763538 RepID=A0A167EE38_9BACL|nr:LysM peptidoglycan-binding domain-containing protein [Paenibacillus crassostreae]OAB75445.1 hypothetical protein PNBC_08775 [Paenibacillus crassostreae]
MFDQSYGLRFDIYERIQLSEDVAGIAELEEIELLPHISVISQEDQATLRGHLLLSGLYRSEGEEAETQQIEHFIPVEITVPLNRVTSLDEIAVEIENFDVDLLSKRSLNITGVLSLRGIESPRIDNNLWNAEDFTVVHAPDWQMNPDILPLSTENIADRISLDNELGKFGESSIESFVQDDLNENEEDYTTELHKDEDALARQQDFSNVWQIETEEQKKALNSLPNDEPKDSLQSDIPVDSSPNTTIENDLLEKEPAEGNEFLIPDEIEAKDEKAELKVALGSKKEVTPTRKDNVGFSSILTSSRARSLRDLEQQLDEEKSLELKENEDQVNNEDVEWKNLFLGGSSDKTPFSKVRLCIVQREETIDMIADRYQMSPRELLLHNRLSDQTIEEGQILYIP